MAVQSNKEIIKRIKKAEKNYDKLQKVPSGCVVWKLNRTQAKDLFLILENVNSDNIPKASRVRLTKLSKLVEDFNKREIKSLFLKFQ